VNLGGDPERDDFGLPPVDIEIPDDARDLDRDVQAYHRELRAQRRRLRARRLHGPLTRDGMVLPLLAGCLVLALISGTLLTLFSAGQADMPGLPGRTAARPATTAKPAAGRGAGSTTAAGQRPASQSAAGQAGASAAAGPSAGSAVPSAGAGPAGTGPARTGPAGTGPAAAAPSVGQVGGPLPDKTLVVAGRSRRLRSLQPAVLALIPAGCQCAAALRQLVHQAAAARVRLYFVGTGGAMGQVRRLAAQAGQRPAQLAEDVHNVLGTTYPAAGLTAILVHANGTVARVAPSLRSGLALTPDFLRLPAGAPAS
jgi:hypothetical protein